MTVPFSWELPYAWPRKPVLARNVVCTSQPLAAQAGLAMLADGGSAVDAALAAAITLTLVEPVSNGIGSDAFAIVWDGERLHGLNASGRSPAVWTPEYFRGGPVPRRGWNSVTVPGAVSAWTELHARFGRLPFARVFEPAIGYGPKGFLVSPTVAAQWAGAGAGATVTARIRRGVSSGWTGAVCRGSGSGFPSTRRRWRRSRPRAGRRSIGASWRRAMEAHSTANGGAMLASDLAAHRADWVDPISIDYRGYTLHEIPPNGQGIVALIALGILQHFDMASLPVDSADSVHLQIEAIKLGIRRRAGLRRRHRPHAGAAETAAGRRLPQAAVDVDRPGAGHTGFGGQAAEGRHGVSDRGRRRRNDGVDDPVQLRRLRFGRSGAGHRDLVAEPRHRVQRDAGAPEPRWAAKAPVPHHRSRLPHQRRRTGDELRRDGRHHAAAGACAADGADRRLRAEPAGGVRWTAVPLATRHAGQPRGRLPARQRSTSCAAVATISSQSTTTTSSAAARRSGGCRTGISLQATRVATGRPPVSSPGPPELRSRRITSRRQAYRPTDTVQAINGVARSFRRLAHADFGRRLRESSGFPASWR